MRPMANWVPVLHVGGLWQMGGLRKEFDLCSKEEDVCGFVGMVEDVCRFVGMVGVVGFD